jgi:hypothetical protein
MDATAARGGRWEGMKLGIAACVLMATLLPATARAAEAPRDVETDHLDAFDDGGPRTFGLLTNPASVLLGLVGAEGDLVLADTVAVSAEADALVTSHASGIGGTLGVPLYPMGVPFHGFVIHPRLSLLHASTGATTVDLGGLLATLGWQWTLPAGLTFRAGAGLRLDKPIGGDASATLGLEGIHPMVDGSVGWVF